VSCENWAIFVCPTEAFGAFRDVAKQNPLEYKSSGQAKCLNI
jgi:hypothetical protein